MCNCIHDQGSYIKIMDGFFLHTYSETGLKGHSSLDDMRIVRCTGSMPSEPRAGK